MISLEVWNCCLGIIKLSIGIDTSAAIFGIMRFNETKELRFKIVGQTQTKTSSFCYSFLFFSLLYVEGAPLICKANQNWLAIRCTIKSDLFLSQTLVQSFDFFIQLLHY